MTSLTSNYFAYPLMGTNCNTDGVNPTEIINYLFKKQLGLANTSKLQTYNSEPSQYNNYHPSTTDLQFSQYIPPNPPDDLIQVNFCNINRFSNIPGQAKYISSNYPYLAFYSNVFMNPTTSAQNLSNSFTISDTNYLIFLTTNSIPYAYGLNNISSENSYRNAIKIRTSNLAGEFSFTGTTDGAWIFDTDSGILNFYDTPTRNGLILNRTTPPRISFWRYEGLIGNNTFMNIGDF